MPQGIQKPSNQIVAYGDVNPIEMEIGANATAAKMLPGRVVIFDDADETVKEAGAAAVNVVGSWKLIQRRRNRRHMLLAITKVVIDDVSQCSLFLLTRIMLPRRNPLVYCS